MAANSLALQVGVAPACRALGVPRATFYRRHRMVPGRQQPRPTPARALCEAERERVLDTLGCDRFVDRSPPEVVATLLDEGQYLCSERTMYRILAANQPVRERRNQLTHPNYTKPELVATGPNQTWSWDITRLLGPKPWTYFYLYVLLDIFSRYTVGWMVAERESSGAGRHAHRANLPQPRHRTPDAHPAFGSRRADDQQVHRTTARRPRGDPFAQPPASQRRQPLLRGAVQDPEVPSQLPRAVRRCRRRDDLLPLVLSLVQHRASTCRNRDAHPPGRPLRSSPTSPRTTRTHPAPRLGPAPGAIRQRNPEVPASSTRGLDQPAGRDYDPTACSVNPNRRCLNVVDRFRRRSPAPSARAR